MLAKIFLLFNIGGSELVLIVLVVIMFFGADKIPEIARGLGKGIRTVRNAANDVKREITDSAHGSSDIAELKETLEQSKREIDEIGNSVKRN